MKERRMIEQDERERDKTAFQMTKNLVGQIEYGLDRYFSAQ
jgi:hypothetical protein